MIRKLVRQMLLAQTFSALTVSLCLMIDSIMIGRFLGKTAIAAYGLANPVLLISGAIGSLLAAGIQVCCGRSIGLGSKEETDRAYSSAAALAAGISLVFMLLVLLLASPLSRLLGAAKSRSTYIPTAIRWAGSSTYSAPFRSAIFPANRRNSSMTAAATGKKRPIFVPGR